MEPFHFKYHPINTAGQATGFFASQGTLDEETLLLDKFEIPLGSVHQVVHRYNRLVVVYAAQGGGAANFVFAPKGGGVDRKLKEIIDRLCSYRWADNRFAQLEKEGKGNAFRTAKCSVCTAVVDLTGFDETPLCYCPYCEGIPATEHGDEAIPKGYRLCDRCQFYSSPIRYTSIYVILNVISSQEHYSCHVCMRRECWKMLLVNLLPPFIGFFIGLFHASRAYGAGMMDSYLPELIRANAYANKGRMTQARPLYDAMLNRVSRHPGLRYNLALGYSREGDWELCAESARAALRDCSNYTPAANLLILALTRLGEDAEAQRFQHAWGVPGGPVVRSAIDSDGIQSKSAPRLGTDDAIREGRREST